MGLVGDGNCCGSGCVGGDFYALDFGWDCSDCCCGDLGGGFCQVRYERRVRAKQRQPASSSQVSSRNLHKL